MAPGGTPVHRVSRGPAGGGPTRTSNAAAAPARRRGVDSAFRPDRQPPDLRSIWKAGAGRCAKGEACQPAMEAQPPALLGPDAGAFGGMAGKHACPTARGIRDPPWNPRCRARPRLRTSGRRSARTPAGRVGLLQRAVARLHRPFSQRTPSLSLWPQGFSNATWHDNAACERRRPRCSAKDAPGVGQAFGLPWIRRIQASDRERRASHKRRGRILGATAHGLCARTSFDTPGTQPMGCGTGSLRTPSNQLERA